MRRYAFTALAVAAISVLASAAQAQTINESVHEMYRCMKRDYHRVNCWPHPWILPDRAASQAPFLAMSVKGWKQQTTVSDYHFQDDGTSLTKAGQMKVNWIVNNVPDPFRTVYVQQANDRQRTTRRLDGVQQYLASSLEGESLPAVLPTRHGEPGHSAEYVQDVYSKFRNTTPDPRLKIQETADNAGGEQ